MNWLKGKKTYIIAALMVARGVLELVTGDIGLSEFINGPYLTEVIAAFGLASLRAGVEKNS
jgi:hypothetical protein